MNEQRTVTQNQIATDRYWLPGFVDSHFHSAAIRDKGVDTYALLTELHTAGMGPQLDVAIVPEDTEDNRNLVAAIPEIERTCGLHPVASGRDDWEQALWRVQDELRTGAFVAVGETGLDWYRMYAPRARQIAVFEAQLAMAAEHVLPVIVHNRDADADCLNYIRRAQLPRGGIMHCYSSSADNVTPFLDAGMYISFAGNVTFKNARELRDAVLRVPDDRLLLETDSPFLTPHPHRGRINHPGMVAYVYHTVARVKSCTVPELVDLVASNFRTLIPPR